MAMGMLVVPTVQRSMNSGTETNAQPMATPMNIARKIHSVRKRSRNDRRLVTLSAICTLLVGPVTARLLTLHRLEFMVKGI